MIAAALAVAGLAAAANADVLAQWTFETSSPVTAGPFPAELGLFAATSNASGGHAGAAVYSSPAGNGSAKSFSSTAWAVGDYYQFTTSTIGYTNIAIQWDQTSSNTGPGHFNLLWSLDNIAYNAIGPVTVLANGGAPNPSWNTVTNSPAYTLGPTAGPASLDNKPIIYFRMSMADTVSANGGVVAAGGTSRLDNVIITAVPGPGSLALLAMGGLLAARRRR